MEGWVSTSQLGEHTVSSTGRPNGMSVPLFLRRRKREENVRVATTSTPGTEATKILEHDILDEFEPHENVFSSEELEERMNRCASAIADIQKQLFRGEEQYFQDTDGHGNVYKGWDAFIDSKDYGDSATAIGSGGVGQTHAGTSSRRMPADHRWFSSSCISGAGRVYGGSGKRRSVSAPVSTVPATVHSKQVDHFSARTTSIAPTQHKAVTASSTGQLTMPVTTSEMHLTLSARPIGVSSLPVSVGFQPVSLKAAGATAPNSATATGLVPSSRKTLVATVASKPAPGFNTTPNEQNVVMSKAATTEIISPLRVESLSLAPAAIRLPHPTTASVPPGQLQLSGAIAAAGSSRPGFTPTLPPNNVEAKEDSTNKAGVPLTLSHLKGNDTMPNSGPESLGGIKEKKKPGHKSEKKGDKSTPGRKKRKRKSASS